MDLESSRDHASLESIKPLSCSIAHGSAARYIYGIIFMLTTLIAWVVRDYSHRALSELHYLEGCLGGHNCLGSEGVLRISFGCFVFFLAMFVTTVGTTRLYGARDVWHNRWWPAKGVMWVILMVLPFLVPPSFIHIYGEVARYGAGIFLLIQLLSVINFIYWWNEQWFSEERCKAPMLVVAFVSFGASIVATTYMSLWFAPHISCTLNIFFTSWTAILINVMTAISLHSKVNAGLMTSGLMSVYLCFLCWSAIMSEPLSEACNTRPRQTGKSDWLTLLSFVIALAAIVMAAYSTGTDSQTFCLPKKSFELDDEVPYGYGFFHLVFALGSMYFAMLFIGWNLHQTMHKYSIDVGWASVWVKIANEWAAAAIYIWTMIGRFVLRNREFP
ncbi:probable serine incorporator [Selaginella moellendorffii]|uniref:probable serine incorporator n=1 Tax=Selaginella moellendorffii TaxID=88036 RepID=UPI000D1C8EF8|nr:probable serine incorporator [Selaginella moellendorffii]XP_024536572.1 probable serine incorporator [Selaginella moellendorffii]|eukprot:XP_024528791.1 probable serine incorporator [Selaginella moellendorffii]